MKKLMCLGLLATGMHAQTPGSLYAVNGRLADSFRDVRAGVVDDIVTIVVSESLSAVSTGATQTSRKSSAQSQVTAALGTLSAASRFANPLNISGNQQLNGSGQTSRTSTLTTTISAKVVEVTANGNLIIEATKEIGINSEKQKITVRGMVRPADLTTQNMVASNQVADLKIQVNGKGVVGDAVRRPNFLYRLILGLLPF